MKRFANSHEIHFLMHACKHVCMCSSETLSHDEDICEKRVVVAGFRPWRQSKLLSDESLQPYILRVLLLVASIVMAMRCNVCMLMCCRGRRLRRRRYCSTSSRSKRESRWSSTSSPWPTTLLVGVGSHKLTTKVVGVNTPLRIPHYGSGGKPH